MQRVFLFALTFIAGFAHGQNLYLTENGKLKEDVYHFISSSLDYQGANDLFSINDFCQKNFLRSPNTERWQVKDDTVLQAKKARILTNLKKLGFFESTSPLRGERFTHVFILGAVTSRMRLRVGFLRNLIKDGLEFDHLHFLTGQRPLDPQLEDTKMLFDTSLSSQPFRSGWTAPQTTPRTESEAARLVWDQLMAVDMKLPQFIDVPMLNAKRPTTADTIHQWLKSNPTKGKTLVISNNPYIPYQHAVVIESLLQAGFITLNEFHLIQTVGSDFAATETSLPVLLDNLARTLFSETKIWEYQAATSAKESQAKTPNASSPQQKLAEPAPAQK